MNDKPTLQYKIVAGGQYEQGFNMSFKATGDKEIQMAYELTKMLIDKIVSIKVNVGEGE